MKIVIVRGFKNAFPQSNPKITNALFILLLINTLTLNQIPILQLIAILSGIDSLSCHNKFINHYKY